MIEVIHSSETSVITRVTWRNIPGDDIHHGHCHENLRSLHILFYSIGGTNSSTVLDVVEYYSIQSNVWCDLAPLPLAVLGAGAAFLDQKLYVVGGKSRTGYENGVWVRFCSL
jgi:hypothetical protein